MGFQCGSEHGFSVVVAMKDGFSVVVALKCSEDMDVFIGFQVFLQGSIGLQWLWL